MIDRIFCVKCSRPLKRDHEHFNGGTGLLTIFVEPCNCEKFVSPPPTVEISLEDAQLMLADVTRSPILSNMGIYQRLKEAISKAEGKDSVNTPALPIQDQVNELRKELSTLKDTISQLQRVIEGMKGKSI